MDLRRKTHRAAASSIHRRGSAYVIALGASMFVMLTGMTALLAAQSQWRATENTVVTAQTRLGAQSAIELGRYLIEADPNWRNNYANDQWNTHAWDHGDLSWKLVDEIDGDLSNDAIQPVRIWGRSTINSGARLCSVLITVEQADNLLENPGFEVSEEPWDGQSEWDDCQIQIDNADPQGGVSCLLSTLRESPVAGPNQLVTEHLTNGQTYYSDVWVKGTGGSNQKILGLMISSETGYVLYGNTVAWSGTDWQKISTTITPTWTGQLYGAWWFVSTFNDVDDFCIDNAVLVEGVEPPAVDTEPVVGSWRWETDN